MGRLTHFMRRDELEAAWRWTDPILQGWQRLADKPQRYPAGSWGPAASSALVARANAVWSEEALAKTRARLQPRNPMVPT